MSFPLRVKTNDHGCDTQEVKTLEPCDKTGGFMSSSQSQAEAFERFCSFSALYDASYKICRNVRWKDSTINFEEQRLENIFATQDALKYDEWIQLLFSCFSIVERGKPRDIRACHIDDRLVHNAFCDEVLTPEISPIFIYDNSAS